MAFDTASESSAADFLRLGEDADRDIVILKEVKEHAKLQLADCYVVTALDQAGHESRFSGEVRASIP